MHRLLIATAVAALAQPGFAAPTHGAGAVRAAAGPAAITTQLPRTVRPVHYDVAITPDAAALRFTGRVAVTIDVLQPVRSITLNAADLSFGTVMLSGVGTAPRVTTDAAAQTATFAFAAPIAPGSHVLTMDYTGKIGTQAVGPFALDYDSKAGKKRALYTQFENSDARRLIPSWDEPAYKATFTVTATVPTGQMAVSNLPVAARQDLGNGTTRVSFGRTPKMSTYLLFFALGDFERTTARSGATEIGIVTQTGMASQGQFALESSVAVLKEYNDYFGVPFPLPKLDNIAGPGRSQFFGAMENWGAIFTFEGAILLDPTTANQFDKQRSFRVAAHEMAHQWFGDLVTMAWWDDLWLNEGFASWMESRTTARLHPEWHTALDAVGDRDTAMRLDALATTHPVVQHVATVEQASQAFDAITYQKGEAVIGMLEDYVGSDVWRAGVRNYMKTHAYGNTVTDDLWRQIDAVSPGKPITEIAHRFTLQPGVPLIRVGTAQCRGGTTTAALTQGEFSVDRPDKAALRWPVPVIAKTLGEAKSIRSIVTGGQATLAVPGCGTIVVNAGQTGYYRTLYAPAAFAAVTKDFARIAPIDQLGIMADSWSLGLAGLQPASDYLELTKATPANADPKIWETIAGGFGSLDYYYKGDARQAGFRSFARARLNPVFAAIGWTARPGEAEPVANLRNRIIGQLGDFGDPAVVAEARRRYAGNDMPAAIRKAVLGVVAANADAATWAGLHAAAKAEKTPLIKQELYDLLAQSADPALAQQALDLALTDEPGATTSAGMISGVADNFPDMAYDFAVAHMTAVDALVDQSSRNRFFPLLAGGSADPAMVGKINAYAAKYLAAGSRRDADTAAARIIYRVKIRRDRLPTIDAWLAKQRG